MEEPENIIRHLEEYFAQQEGDLKGKTVLITTGPTYEKIDPVRFIGNYSSGKMGVALADECTSRGAKVILVAGPMKVQPRYPVYRRYDVESADEMYAAACSAYAEADAAILAAAVADYKPAAVAQQKVKRETTGPLQLDLTPTHDIAAELGRRKAMGEKRRVLVGFALETNDEMSHASDKLQRKNLDFIVLNSLQDAGAGFQCDTNKVTLLDRQGAQTFPLKSKSEVAVDIVNRLATLLDSHPSEE